MSQDAMEQGQNFINVVGKHFFRNWRYGTQLRVYTYL